jgi:ATP-dependent helicase/DNAse subunit B
MHQYAKEQYKIIEKQCDYSDELIVKITKQNNNIKNETIEKNIYDMVIKNTVYKEYCAYKIQCEELKKQIENTSKKCSLCNTLKKQIEDTQKKNKNLEINYNAICREFEILKHMQPVNSQMRPPIQQLMNPQSMQQLMNPPVQQPKNKLNLNAVAFNPSFI